MTGVVLEEECGWEREREREIRERVSVQCKPASVRAMQMCAMQASECVQCKPASVCECVCNASQQMCAMQGQ